MNQDTVSNYFTIQYLHIAKRISNLKRYVTFSDDNLKTYSNEIADLIIAVGIELENITDNLCKLNNLPDTNFVQNLYKIYKLYDLKSKEVIVSGFVGKKKQIANKILPPFLKSKVIFDKRGNGILSLNSYSNGYNNLKHDRVKCIKAGNLENLLNIFSCYYILLIYNEFHGNTYQFFNLKIDIMKKNSSLLYRIFSNPSLYETVQPKIFIDEGDIHKKDFKNSIILIHRPEKRYGNHFHYDNFESELASMFTENIAHLDPIINILIQNQQLTCKYNLENEKNNLWFYQLNTFNNNHIAIKESKKRAKTN